MLQLKALDHVGLKVRDLEKSLHFYQQLGLKVLRTKGPDAAGVRMRRNIWSGCRQFCG